MQIRQNMVLSRVELLDIVDSEEAYMKTEDVGMHVDWLHA